MRQPMNDEQAHRVIALLNRQEIDVLDKIGKDALFSTGVKLPRTAILKALVQVCLRLDVSGDGVKSSEEFADRVLQELGDGEIVR